MVYFASDIDVGGWDRGGGGGGPVSNVSLNILSGISFPYFSFPLDDLSPISSIPSLMILTMLTITI